MSLLINGTDMPKDCLFCPCCRAEHNYDGSGLRSTQWFCQAIDDMPEIVNIYNYRLPDCPLSEVPTPHGRLIDADRLIRRLNGIEYIANAEGGRPTFSEVLEEIANAPTVIEAEE